LHIDTRTLSAYNRSEGRAQLLSDLWARRIECPAIVTAEEGYGQRRDSA
jgi:hypothetical protein